MSEPGPVWLDGDLVPAERATVGLHTHSLHYGSAVFDGGRFYRCDDDRLYRELADFSLGRDLSAASVIFRNLYDEGGGETSAGAHPFLLQRLLLHLGIPCGFADVPELPQALAYLSNRIRCSRRSNPAWGLAVLFSLEYGTPTTHGNIYRLLRRFEVPEEFCEFHHLHMSADVEHAEDLVRLIREVIVSAEDRAIFLASLRHHRALGRRYFDAIWREIQAIREP